jgi:hypothetical protein
VYGIGAFIWNTRLIANENNEIKKAVDSIYGRNITFPGLMFDFNQFYPKGENIPRKYNYQQEFIYILHYTFNVPYITMSMNDREEICSIILKFNNYYKNEFYNNNEKRCNSPLYCCTLSCLLDIPYFRKYKSILDILPLKDKGTSNLIKNTWFKFLQSNPELFKQYNSTSVSFMNNNQIMEYNGKTNNFEIELKKSQYLAETKREELEASMELQMSPDRSSFEELHHEAELSAVPSDENILETSITTTLESSDKHRRESIDDLTFSYYS